jgi:hypothetical protein
VLTWQTKRKKELPTYVYVNPADIDDEIKYALKAARLNEVCGQGKKFTKYEGYVNVNIPNRSAVICVLN